MKNAKKSVHVQLAKGIYVYIFGRLVHTHKSLKFEEAIGYWTSVKRSSLQARTTKMIRKFYEQQQQIIISNNKITTTITTGTNVSEKNIFGRRRAKMNSLTHTHENIFIYIGAVEADGMKSLLLRRCRSSSLCVCASACEYVLQWMTSAKHSLATTSKNKKLCTCKVNLVVNGSPFVFFRFMFVFGALLFGALSILGHKMRAHTHTHTRRLRFNDDVILLSAFCSN